MTSIPNGSAVASSLQSDRRGKQRMLESNRKLRHVRGISVRNLAFGSSLDRSQTKAFDDEAIPYSLKSPSRLLSVTEENASNLSRSFSDFQSLPTSAHPHETRTSRSPSMRRSSQSSGKRPRGTLQRANTSPRQRKDALDEVLSKRVGSVFFSLHSQDSRDPYYISELVENTMNTDFRFFDLSVLDSSITCMEELSIRIWASSHGSGQWSLLRDDTIDLRQLHFIGTNLDTVHQPFTDNALLLHLNDGIYATFIGSSGPPAADLKVPSTQHVPYAEPTSSYDALMRLSTLDQIIQDSFATRRRIAADVQKLITENKLRSSIEDRISTAQDTLATTRRAVVSEGKQVKSSNSRLEELRKALHTRRSLISDGRAASDRTASHLQDNREKLHSCHESHKQTLETMTGQRRRVCEDLLEIYPIEAIPGRSLAFTIRGLALPNSTFQDAKEDIVSAALGHVAHVVYMLSFYLSVPLPYQIHLRSSSSSMTDPISIMAGSRAFPLYMKGSVFYRFEYAVFLLNKNIELLAAHLGLKILDIRQTLPNLKYVLFVATAGQGELPSRKAGGIRGLLFRAGEKNTPNSSRGGSPDSYTASRTSGLRSIAALRSSG